MLTTVVVRARHDQAVVAMKVGVDRLLLMLLLLLRLLTKVGLGEVGFRREEG